MNSLRFSISIAVTLFWISASFGQSISSVDPDSAYQGQGLIVSISGSGLNFVQGTSTQVWLQQGGAIINANVQNVQAASISSNFNIPSIASLGLYNVHVGSNGISGVELTNGFEVLPAPALLNPPTLILPSSGASLTSNPVDFSWSAVSGASGYEYQVASDVAFDNVYLTGQIAGTTVSEPIQVGTYYWRVRTANVASVYGSWSSAFSFDVSQTTSLTSVNPASGHQGQDLDLTISGLNLEFNQGTSTIHFTLEMGPNTMYLYVNGPDPQFNGTDFVFSEEAGLDIPNNIPTGLYDLNYTDPSSQTYTVPQAFEVLDELPAPQAPVLVTPINGESVGAIPVQFDWNDLPDIELYQMQINNTSDFSNPLYMYNETSSDVDVSLYGGSYFWRARARNLSGIWGAWSQPEDFEVTAVTQITDMNPDQGYAGQSLPNVSISGVNLPFNQSTQTTGELYLQQGNFEIESLAEITSPTGGVADFEIPVNAPTGYYDLHYEPSPFGPYSLLNAFLVTEGNEYAGQVFVDYNQNQVFDGSDVPYPYGVLNVDPDPNYASSQTTGLFTGHVPPGNYSLTVDANYYTVSPAQHNLSFSGSGGVDSDNDFALQPIAGMHDMMTVISTNPVRSGSTTRIYVSVRNMGTETESGQFSATFPSGMTVLNSSNSNYTITGNTVTWDFTGLVPLDHITVWAKLEVPTSFQIGQIVSFSSQVTDVSTDETPQDNTDQITAEVINSYDPNYKQTSFEYGTLDQLFATGEYLNYTVHFQNVGTAEAIDIYILDTISDLLDLSTFQFITSSHDHVVNMLNDRVVEFRFDGIDLPDSTSNEPESNGFVSYRIKPIGNLQPNEIVENTAYIYFDFNEPVITNTTESWISVGIDEVDSNKNFGISPNPSTGMFNIWANGKATLQLLDTRGRHLQSSEIDKSGGLDLTEYQAGVYLMLVEINGENFIEKLVKY